MAKFGAKYPCFAPITAEAEGALPTYGDGMVMGGLVSANLTVTLASGELWADDRLDEQLSEFASGSLAMETADMTDEVAAAVYGATVENGEVRYNKEDVSPMGGLAYYKTLMRRGKKYYQGYFLPKVRAALGNDNAQTRNNTITFTTTSTTFTVFAPDIGDWRITKTFEREQDAKAWVADKLNIGVYHEVKVASSGNGSVSPQGDLFVKNGGSLELTITGTPTALYDNGIDSLSAITDDKYKITDVTKDHEIVIVF